jgi:hypothetical protein
MIPQQRRRSRRPAHSTAPDILITGGNGGGVVRLIKTGHVHMTWAYDNYANGNSLPLRRSMQRSAWPSRRRYCDRAVITRATLLSTPPASRWAIRMKSHHRISGDRWASA